MIEFYHDQTLEDLDIWPRSIVHFGQRVHGQTQGKIASKNIWKLTGKQLAHQYRA